MSTIRQRSAPATSKSSLRSIWASHCRYESDQQSRSRMTGLPDWWEPLLTRVRTAEAVDFTRLPTPDADGLRQSAVLVLFGEQPGIGPDVLVLERAHTMRNHAGQPAFPGGAAEPGDAD